MQTPVKTDQTVHLKRMHFVVYELDIHKVGASHSLTGIKRFEVIRDSGVEEEEEEDINVGALPCRLFLQWLEACVT